MSRPRQDTPILDGDWFLGTRRKKHKKRNRIPRTKLETWVREGYIFTSSREQIRLMLEINEAVWKDLAIPEQAIRELGDPPERPATEDDNLSCVTLLSDTGDLLETLARNVLACKYMHGVMHTEKTGDLMLAGKYVRQRKGAQVRRKGLRWAVCELGRKFRDQRAIYVTRKLARQNLIGMGQELPLIAAMHPHWAEAMEGNLLPFVSAPDLEVNLLGRQVEFTNTLCVSRSEKGAIVLGAYGIAAAMPNYGHGFFR